jgi:hypothetical protein
LLQGMVHYSWTFLFCDSFFFWLCTSVLALGHYAVAEIWYNWYHRDINIFYFIE